jgi:hypothetical protein
MAEPIPQDDHYYSVLTRELEHVRASCNSLASERDLLVRQLEAAERFAQHDPGIEWNGDRATLLDAILITLDNEREDNAHKTARLLAGASNLLAANRSLSDQLRRALAPERNAA